MTQRIVQFTISQTSKVIALLYGMFGFIFWAISLFISLAQTGQIPQNNYFLLFPVLMPVLGYLFTLIGCALYNRIAAWIGGIEFVVAKVMLPEVIQCPGCNAELALNDRERTEEKFVCSACQETFIVKD